MQPTPQDGYERPYDENPAAKQPSTNEGLEYLGDLLRATDSDSIGSLPYGIQAIIKTAQKYPNSSVTDPVVADELVGAILADHWGASLDREQTAEMHHSISQSLLEDPVARERLVQLWNQVIDYIDNK